MLGTPARLLMLIRMMLNTQPLFAYSRMYNAAMTPNGITAIDMIKVITIVPQSAGKNPPSIPPSRGWPNKNSNQRIT